MDGEVGGEVGGGRRRVRRDTALEHRYLEVYVDTVRDEAGREFQYIHGTGPDIVHVVPIHADGTVTLISQWRYGMDARSIEVAGGIVDPGEEPAAAADRELREETGLVAGRVEPVTDYLLSVKIQEPMHVFRALDLTEGPADLDADEDIEVLRVPFADAVAMCLDGRMRHGPSLVAILAVHALETA